MIIAYKNSIISSFLNTAGNFDNASIVRPGRKFSFFPKITDFPLGFTSTDVGRRIRKCNWRTYSIIIYILINLNQFIRIYFINLKYYY